MTDERRYQEEEVAEIFEAAAAPGKSRREAGPGKGLTLAELQDIGREVGIAPERIAEAASSLERRPTRMPRRTELGMPVSVGRTIDLPRPMTDREWALLVAELRATFSARGHESSHGVTRQWTNGNLHAFVEPTATGYRLRLGTLKGDALAMNRLGGLGVVMALLMSIVFVARGELSGDLAVPLLMGMMGASAFAANMLRLPRWAREREEQMDYIAERARALIGVTRDSP
jgi:hypothetical protein